MEVDEHEDEETKKLLGVDEELYTPGCNADVTEGREEAIEIIDHPERQGRNARQTMLKHKQGHGAGVDLTFPDAQTIQHNMQDFDEDYLVPVYGDGSYTTPTKAWAALGGCGAWFPDWNKEGEDKPHRRERDLAYPAIGQNSSSTRQELAMWLLILTEPVRTMYATDSASMLNKAKQLLAAAKRIAEEEEQGKHVRKDNPYKRPWGLQRDGDLWQQAWTAILQRGVESQDLRKVKGHATPKDIAEGRSNKIDAEGNDRSDKNADKGVELIMGRGLVVLGKWLAKRHDGYVQFMKRIQKMIATITKAEKEERSKQNCIDKATLGYDPLKWIKSQMQLRDKEQEQCSYINIRMPPPVKGIHKFTYCHGLYKDIHRFIANRKWAPIDKNNNTSGATWMELFILFDTSGARTAKGQHVKDPEAKKRADLRQGNSRRKGKGDCRRQAITHATMGAEINRFKAIVRHVARHEMAKDQSKWFCMEERSRLKRLAELGITGHQPAIAAYVQITQEERQVITQSIMMQKVGSSSKSNKSHHHYLEERKRCKAEGKADDEERILIKLARVANGACVRWKRLIKDASHEQEEIESIDEANPANSRPQTDTSCNYTSRLISCSRCGQQQETRRMQLRTKEGYRAIHCSACGKQERSSHNVCQCGVIWHQCEVHRMDPKVHASRKGIVGSKSKEGEAGGKKLESTRRPPSTKEVAQKRDMPKGRIARSKFDEDRYRHTKFQASSNPPRPDLIQKIRDKVARQARRNASVQDGTLGESIQSSTAKPIGTCSTHANLTLKPIVTRQEMRTSLNSRIQLARVSEANVKRSPPRVCKQAKKEVGHHSIFQQLARVRRSNLFVHKKESGAIARILNAGTVLAARGVGSRP